MLNKQAKVTIHMVASLDGFVAKPDESIEWLNYGHPYENGISLSKEEIDTFLKSINCYVMGSKTYEKALNYGWPYGDTPVFVISQRKLMTKRSTVKFLSGSLNSIFQEISSSYKNIWMVGGPTLAKEMLNLKLAHEIILSIIPIILGSGKLFFDQVNLEQKLILQGTKTYNNGMVEIHYKIPYS